MTTRTTAAIAATILLAFGAFSIWVIGTHGYFGYLTSARNDHWTLQLLIDLTLSLVIANAWVVTDARRRGISPWPYVIATPVVGSLAIGVYLIRRAFAADLSGALTHAQADTRATRASVG